MNRICSKNNVPQKINLYSFFLSSIDLNVSTWEKDSHGLFDY
jgi:hypothetical protein